MARRYQMTWQASTRRWFKKHNGKMYIVSCRQLGVAPSKEESGTAANAWWEGKLKEIESAPPTEQDLQANAMKVWTLVHDWQHLDEDSRQALVDKLIGSGQYKKLKEQAEKVVSAVKEAPPDRTMNAQVEAWRTLLLSTCRSGQMSEGRYDAYRRNIEKFMSWVGPDTAIDAIDEVKLEGFFNHLSVSVAGGQYSANYAHGILMTVKQFISRLAELRLIPLPGNIRSRRFRFNHSAPAKIETFRVPEVRALLAACDRFSERTKLYLLLMLNCGMYQNDISELRMDEVEWNAGTLTRARSKTRERNGPVVTYKLWPETFILLKKHKAKEGNLALTSAEGNPLVRFWLEGTVMRRYDCVQSCWWRLATKMGVKKMRLGMKHLRKTSATMLAQHPQFKFFANHFLADSPRAVAERHYVKPSDREFFLALDWLRVQLLEPECGELPAKHLLDQQA